MTGKRWPRCFWLYARWPDRDGHVAKPVLGGRLKGERDPLSCLETAIAIHDNHGEVRPATSGGLCRVDYAESLVGTPLSNRSFRGHAASMTFRSVDSSAGIQTRSDQSATSDLPLPAVQVRPENCKVVHRHGSQRGSHRPVTITPWSSSPPSGLCPAPGPHRACQAPLTGSGYREHSYGGFGGGHPHFRPHATPAGNPRIRWRDAPGGTWCGVVFTCPHGP